MSTLLVGPSIIKCLKLSATMLTNSETSINSFLQIWLEFLLKTLNSILKVTSHL